MKPRQVKMLAILCGGCGLWVKPRRYDPALHVCWDCIAAADVRPSLIDSALDVLPGVAAALDHLPMLARNGGAR